MIVESRNKFLTAVFLFCALVGIGVLQVRLANAARRNLAWVNAALDLTGDNGMEVCPQLLWADGVPRAFSQDLAAAVLGLYEYAAQDNVRAQETWARVVAPTETEMFWRGCAAWGAGDAARALEAWRDARAESYFFNHAKSAYQARNVPRAVALYEIGLQLAPDSKEGWENLAEMQFDRAAGGQLPWNAAVEVFERQIELDPENAMAHYRIGYGLWASRGDWERAEAELRFAWARGKHWLIAYALGSLLVDKTKSAEAVGLLEYAFSKSDNAWTRFNLMRAYANVGRCAEAETAKNQALAKYPDILNPLRAWCRTSAACVCESLP